MEDASDETLAVADLIVSVTPPSQALALAQRLAPAIAAGGRAPLYVDANAVSPEATRAVDSLVARAGARFVDAGVIGPPPRPGFKPAIYASGPHAPDFQSLAAPSLDVRLLPGPIGQASALKLCYSALNKGLLALAAAAILGAQEAGVETELTAELEESQPGAFGQIRQRLPGIFPKAYRWDAEMLEIADFLGGPAGPIYQGAAEMFRRLAADHAGPGADETAILHFLNATSEGVKLLHRRPVDISSATNHVRPRRGRGAEMQRPTIQLNDGAAIPQIGMGTAVIGDHDVVEMVRTSLEAGYRHLDTATAYGTDAAVGEAIRTSGVPRSEIFLVSKMSDFEQGYDKTLAAFDADAKRIGVDYLDLYLIHWPNPELDLYVETWKAFIRLRDEGRIRSIGVSNFEPEHIERLIAETGVAPVLNQVEISPRFQQRGLREACARLNVAVASWSPLVGGTLTANPMYGDIARKYGRSPAQIVLRWHVQNGLIIVPKAEKREWMDENLAVFDFALEEDDMAAIDALDEGEAGRFGPRPAQSLAERIELVKRIMAEMQRKAHA